MSPAFLLLDKPEGPTSHDVVDTVRRATGQRRVGHAGTLDPFASGLLIIAVGREATREISRFVGLSKCYEATFVLGARSDTDDRMGRIVPNIENRMPTRSEIEIAIRTLVGEIDQVPPAYAAIKIGGKKMYEAARAGKPLEAKPRRVTVSRFELLDSPTPYSLLPTAFLIHVRIDCSSGTYVRALARDLGETLGTGSYVEKLRRESIGPFQVSEAISMDVLNADWHQGAKTLEEMLERLPEDATPDTLKA